jgi:hypothetical protein
MQRHPDKFFGHQTPEQPFRRGSRIGIQYELMRRPKGITVEEIIEITGCSRARVRSAVSEIRSRIGEESVITHSYGQDTLKTRYEIRTNLIEEETANIESIEAARKTALASTITGPVQKIQSEIRSFPGNDFMKVSYEGSKAVVVLNSNHKHVQRLKGDENSIKVLEEIAVAFDFSMQLIAQAESSKVLHALELFRTEFSAQLNKIRK